MTEAEKTKPYYMDQSDWGSNEFYALHRYMHRMITKKDKKLDEIKQMNLSRMSDISKVLLYCIIEYYGLEGLLEFENLSSLKNCKPLKEPLILDACNANQNTVYGNMNVII